MKLPLPLLIAVQFLTRIPVRLAQLPDAQDNGRSLLWYPAVGLLIGLLLVLLHYLLVSAAPMLQAAVLLAAWVWISGGLHLDGLADTADAWAGGQGDRERTLQIMKDPSCGPSGVVALLLVLLLKFAALVSLLSSEQQYQIGLVLVLVPAIGRLLLPALLVCTPYARPNGMGAALASNAPGSLPLLLAAQCLIVTIIFVSAWGVAGIMPVLGAALFFLYWRRALVKRLGGTTGDTAGALVELTETLLLLTLAIFC